MKGSKELPFRWDLSIKASARKAFFDRKVWLREPGGFLGSNSRITRENRAKSDLDNNFANFMHQSGGNLGINLVGKSNLPDMKDTALMSGDEDMINKDMPIMVVDGKK